MLFKKTSFLIFGLFVSMIFLSSVVKADERIADGVYVAPDGYVYSTNEEQPTIHEIINEYDGEVIIWDDKIVKIYHNNHNDFVEKGNDNTNKIININNVFTERGTTIPDSKDNILPINSTSVKWNVEEITTDNNFVETFSRTKNKQVINDKVILDVEKTTKNWNVVEQKIDGETMTSEKVKNALLEIEKMKKELSSRQNMHFTDRNDHLQKLLNKAEKELKEYQQSFDEQEHIWPSSEKEAFLSVQKKNDTKQKQSRGFKFVHLGALAAGWLILPICILLIIYSIISELSDSKKHSSKDALKKNKPNYYKVDLENNINSEKQERKTRNDTETQVDIKDIRKWINQNKNTEDEE